MAFLGPGGFDASKHKPMTVHEPLPGGKYLAAIVASDMRRTRRGDGEYLWLKFQILGGEHKGRHLFGRLNIRNRNAEAVAIANSELTSICHATGVMKTDDSVDFHDIPLVIDVRRRRRHDTGDIVNEICNYLPRESRVAEASTANSDNGRPPWEQ